MVINQIEEKLSAFDGSYKEILLILKSTGEDLIKIPNYLFDLPVLIYLPSYKISSVLQKNGKYEFQFIPLNLLHKFKDQPSIFYDPSFLDEENLHRYFDDYMYISKDVESYVIDIIKDYSPVENRFYVLKELRGRFERAFFKTNELLELYQLKRHLFDLTWNTLKKKHPYFFDRYDHWLTSFQDSPKKSLKKRSNVELNLEICERIANFKINQKEFISHHEGGSKSEILYKLLTNKLSVDESKKSKLYSDAWLNHSVYFLIYKLEKITTFKIDPTAIQRYNVLVLRSNNFFKRSEFYKFRSRNPEEYENKFPEIAKQINDQLDALNIR